jgi:prolyl-tRNA synthetase
MRCSTLFGETLREAPADVDIPSHQLMMRAGYVRQVAAGIFSYLPLAWRSIRKIEQILREEMDAIGGQEMNMPVVHPAELWEATGRYQTIDETMVRFRDRKGHPMLLAMTHEEAVALHTASEVKSYRQLPALVYQMQTKFRDEARPRGGLIRVREFIMKDSYSLDRDEAGLRKQYAAHYNAYFRMFARAGIRAIAVASDTGIMGGRVAHEFMYLTPIGEDSLAVCEESGYAANLEVARFRKDVFDSSAPAQVQRVHTPDTKTIADLAAFLGIDARQTAKVVFCMAKFADREPKLVIGVVRGDMEANLTALRNLAGALDLRPAQADEIRAAGAEPGYGSPIGVNRGMCIVIADDLVMESPNLVCGANEEGYHLTGVCAGRDWQPDVAGHIALAYDGAPCPLSGKPMKIVRGVEIGNIFQLGTKYTAALGAHYVDEAGVSRPVIMGSYGIGVGRLLACCAEEHRDKAGLRLPISVAPFEVLLVALAKDPATKERAEALYAEFKAAGIDVLYDDREATPGVKFADADLRGIPVRVTISDRGIRNGTVEVKRRDREEFATHPIAGAVAATKALCAGLHAEIAAKAAAAPTWKE